MAQPFDLATPVVRGRAGFQSDFARRQRAEKTQDLVARELSIENLLSTSSTPRTWNQRLAISNPTRTI